MAHKKKNKPKRLKPLSLYPLKTEKVLAAFMKTKPKRALSSA